MDCSLPGSSIHGILQARILEWVAIPFSRGLPDPAMELASPALQADSLPLSHLGSPWLFFLPDSYMSLSFLIYEMRVMILLTSKCCGEE